MTSQEKRQMKEMFTTLKEAGRLLIVAPAPDPEPEKRRAAPEIGDRVLVKATGKEFDIIGTQPDMFDEEVILLVKDKKGILELKEEAVTIIARRLF